MTTEEIILTYNQQGLKNGFMDYKKKVLDYSYTLTDAARDVANHTFISLLNEGYNIRCLYYSIKKLNNRDIIQYKNLLFYDAFQQEVQELVNISYCIDLDNLLFNYIEIVSESDLNKYVDIEEYLDYSVNTNRVLSCNDLFEYERLNIQFLIDKYHDLLTDSSFRNLIEELIDRAWNI